MLFLLIMELQRKFVPPTTPKRCALVIRHVLIRGYFSQQEVLKLLPTLEWLFGDTLNGFVFDPTKLGLPYSYIVPPIDFGSDLSKLGHIDILTDTLLGKMASCQVHISSL